MKKIICEIRASKIADHSAGKSPLLKTEPFSEFKKGQFFSMMVKVNLNGVNFENLVLR